MNNKGVTVATMVILILLALCLLTVSTIALNKLIETGDSNIVPDDVKPSLVSKDKSETNKKEESNETILTRTEMAYKKLEDKLLNTAKTYVTTKNLNTANLKITLDELVSLEYINEIVDPFNRKNKCEGYVTVINDEYNSYIKCGDSYKTENYNM